jgi:Flp pilus assembly protein TadB
MNPLFVGATLGAAVGAGVLLIRHGLTISRAPLLDTFAAAETARRPVSGSAWSRVIEVVANAKAGDTALEADLAVLNRTRYQFALSRLTLTAVLGALPIIVSALIAASTGHGWNPLTVIVAAALLGAIGFALSRLTVASEASARREGFVAELAAYLDMVAQLLSGGAGVEDALWRAARHARSPGIEQIRDALQAARTSRRSEWHALGALASRTRVSELGELVTAVQLAGNSGAKVSASLIAKARSLRDRNASSQLAAAQRSSERMGGPLIGMLLAFLVLVIAPALAAVMRI